MPDLAAHLAVRLGDAYREKYETGVDESGSPALRSAFERDTDRILASTAFQRLSGVTQVVPATTGNVVHTRLTHSLKVGRIARRLCQRVLREHPELHDQLDPESAEAAGLAHDLGHPPFGHVAEDELNGLLMSHGGFEGNAQTFRVVTRLAQRVPWDVGLDLTRMTLNGVIKYPWSRPRPDQKARQPARWKKFAAYAEDKDAFEFARSGYPDGSTERSLNAEIMDWADDLTYALHDLTDFYCAGVVPLDRLCTDSKERTSFQHALSEEFGTSGRLEHVSKVIPKSDFLNEADEMFQIMGIIEEFNGRKKQRQQIRERVSYYTKFFMESFDVVPDAEAYCGYRVRIEPKAVAWVEALKQLTWHYVINRPQLASVQRGQRRVVRELFEIYAEAAQGMSKFVLPPLEQQRVEDGELPVRLAADLVSRLSEERAFEVHARMTGAKPWTLPAGEH